MDFVSKMMSLVFNMLSRLVLAFLSRSNHLLISWIIHSDFGAKENKICYFFHFFPLYLLWNYGTGCYGISFLNVECQASVFTLFFQPHQEALYVYTNIYSHLCFYSSYSKVETNQIFTKEQMDNQMWYIQTVNHYLAIKKNEVLIHATMWVNRDNIILSERSYSQKTTHYVVLFIWKSRSVEIERLVVVLGHREKKDI